MPGYQNPIKQVNKQKNMKTGTKNTTKFVNTLGLDQCFFSRASHFSRSFYLVD